MPNSLIRPRFPPQSWFVFFFNWLLTSKGYQVQGSLEWLLRRVCRLVCESSRGFTLDGISLDESGKVLNASALWPQDLATTIQRAWDADLLVQSNFWIQSSYDHPLLADCICFPFRPVLVSSGRRAVREAQDLTNATKGIALKLLRVLAEAVHQNINLVTISQGLKRKTVNEQERLLGGKTKKIKLSWMHQKSLRNFTQGMLLGCFNFDGTFFDLLLPTYFPGICIGWNH